MYYLQQMNAVIDYMEESITSEISHRKIEKISGCSYDSFQRIFSYITGLSIADYLRCRRLTLAASELVNGKSKVIDIALAYGYASSDSFTKAFYRFHGILPSEIQKRPAQIKLYPRIMLEPAENQDIARNSAAQIKNYEGGTKMDIIYLEKHVICNAEEKREAMKTVNTLMHLGQIAKAYGLLSLVEEYQSNYELTQNPLLQIGISYLADGVEPDEVRGLLENYLISSGKNGKDFLDGLIIIEGLLGIQQGMNLYVISERICSYFGLEFRDEFIENCQLFRTRFSYQDAFKKQIPLSEQTRLLEKYQTMPKRSLQRLIRDIEPEVLAIALSGSGFPVIELFFQNMSERNIHMICDRMREFHAEEAQIMDAQKSIGIITEQLMKQGEIVW